MIPWRSKPVRVLLVASPPFDQIGGVSTHVYMLRDGLKNLGHQVWVVPERPVRLYRAPVVTLPSLLLGRFSQYAACRWSYITKNLYYLVDSLMRSGFKPDAINIQSVQHVHMARRLKALTGSRIVLTVHGFLTYEAEQAGWCRPGDRLWNWLWSMEKAGYGAVDHVVAVSTKTARYVEEFSHAPITVIYNGIDTERFRPAGSKAREDSANDTRSLHLLFAGVLEPHKGLLDAVEVLARLRKAGIDASLAVAGGGIEEGKAKRLADELGVGPYICWHGVIPKSRMPEFYAGGDTLLVPSKPRGSGGQEETFGYTALEAMACGVPVIAYRTGGLAEQIEDGITGYLTPEGDKAAMAEAAARLADVQVREEMGRNARRHVEEHFSALSMARKFVAVYQSALGAS